jgi:ABC-type Na+ efflux pump permease subunit
MKIVNKKRGFITQILIFIIAVMLVGGGVSIYKNMSESKEVETAVEIATTTTAEVEMKSEDRLITDNILATTTIKAEVKSNSAVFVSKDPWAVFDKQKEYGQAKDFGGYMSLSYNQYPACTNKAECDMIFEIVNAVADSINKNEYVNKWEDSKQIILSTKVKKTDTSTERSYRKDYLFFVKDSNGNVKVLGNSSSGLSISKSGSNSTNEAQTAELEISVLDTDQDGISDIKEKCEGASQYDKSCKKTDPTKRDTDGDGWWDGVEDKFE